MILDRASSKEAISVARSHSTLHPVTRVRTDGRRHGLILSADPNRSGLQWPHGHVPLQRAPGQGGAAQLRGGPGRHHCRCLRALDLRAWISSLIARFCGSVLLLLGRPCVVCGPCACQCVGMCLCVVCCMARAPHVPRACAYRLPSSLAIPSSLQLDQRQRHLVFGSW